MQAADRILTQRLRSLPVTEAERARALRLIGQGEAVAGALLALARLFHRTPHPKHAAR